LPTSIGEFDAELPDVLSPLRVEVQPVSPAAHTAAMRAPVVAVILAEFMGLRFSFVEDQ